MTVAFEDLQVLQTAEAVADTIWRTVQGWQSFDRDVVGKQFASAVDSIGANIAESYGRYHYGEKLQFLYFARGSLFETKYWLNRALSRQLIAPDEARVLALELTSLARQLNAMAMTTRRQKQVATGLPGHVRESAVQYGIEAVSADDLFADSELVYLESL
jgi:four helix bundle protein